MQKLGTEKTIKVLMRGCMQCAVSMIICSRKLNTHTWTSKDLLMHSALKFYFPLQHNYKLSLEIDTLMSSTIKY